MSFIACSFCMIRCSPELNHSLIWRHSWVLFGCPSFLACLFCFSCSFRASLIFFCLLLLLLSFFPPLSPMLVSFPSDAPFRHHFLVCGRSCLYSFISLVVQFIIWQRRKTNHLINDTKVVRPLERYSIFPSHANQPSA